MNITSTFDGQVINGLDDDDMLTAAHNNVILYGGSGNDFLISTGADVLNGIVGVDSTTMDGGAGGDYLIGGGTNDTASYANDPAPVVVDLSSFSATDGTGGTDTLVGIENVTGSAFADILIGDEFPNVLQGGAGNDTLTGGLGPDVFKYAFDLMQGGGGEMSRFTDFFVAHGGIVSGGEVADGTKQGQFSSLYTQWLESLGLNVLDLGQNSGPDGMPVVEGPDGTFSERESFTWTSGSGKKLVMHERWYSDTWSSGSGAGQPAVTSGDGFDTIVDFTFGQGGDKLEFNGLDGLTVDQFTRLFAVTQADVTGDGIADNTTLALADGTWEVTLVGVSGHTAADFFAASIFS